VGGSFGVFRGSDHRAFHRGLRFFLNFFDIDRMARGIQNRRLVVLGAGFGFRIVRGGFRAVAFANFGGFHFFGALHFVGFAHRAGVERKGIVVLFFLVALITYRRFQVRLFQLHLRDVLCERSGLLFRKVGQAAVLGG